MPVGSGGVFDHQAGDRLTEAFLQGKARAAHEWDWWSASRQTGVADITHANDERQAGVGKTDKEQHRVIGNPMSTRQGLRHWKISGSETEAGQTLAKEAVQDDEVSIQEWPADMDCRNRSGDEKLGGVIVQEGVAGARLVDCLRVPFAVTGVFV